MCKQVVSYTSTSSVYQKLHFDKLSVTKVGRKVIYYVLLAYCLIPQTLMAQCAMCRASLQGDSNVEQAAAVNDGIVYLMAIPYILIAGIGYYIYRMYTKKK